MAVRTLLTIGYSWVWRTVKNRRTILFICSTLETFLYISIEEKVAGACHLVLLIWYRPPQGSKNTALFFDTNALIGQWIEATSVPSPPQERNGFQKARTSHYDKPATEMVYISIFYPIWLIVKWCIGFYFESRVVRHWRGFLSFRHCSSSVASYPFSFGFMPKRVAERIQHCEGVPHSFQRGQQQQNLMTRRVRTSVDYTNGHQQALTKVFSEPSELRPVGWMENDLSKRIDQF